MKTQSFLLSLFVVLTSALPLQAQFYFGVQGGVGFATMIIKQNSPERLPDFTLLIRPLGGIIAGYQFSNSLAVQTEINYLTKGYFAPYKRYDSTVAGEQTSLFGYFEIPLLVRYTLPQIVPALDIHILAGPSISILESIHVKSYSDLTRTINGVTTTERLEFDQTLPKSMFNDPEISIGGGIGVSYAVGNASRIFCTGRYMFGLTDISTDNNIEVQNRTLHLNLGYMLTL